MSYPFVQAAYDYGPRTAPVRAFLVHMAEGGGTVGYLSRAPERGVSVHYVIEYSGRIVQMLLESHASGSVNPTLLRTTDDADGFYGVTVARAVMGGDWSDPNSAVISVEIEGFAAAGPNPAQNAALTALVDDVRSRHPGIGLLGHRDFASYKACPGKLIHWQDLGGHGAISMAMTLVPLTYLTSIAPKTGTKVLDSPGGKLIYTTKDGEGFPQVADTGTYHVMRMPGNIAGFVPHGSLTGPPAQIPQVVDCTDAIAAELERAATRASTAVLTRPQP